MLFAEIPQLPEHPSNCMEDLAQQRRRELLPSMSHAGKGCEEGGSCFPNVTAFSVGGRQNSQGELPSFHVSSVHGGWGEGCWLWMRCTSFVHSSFPQLIEGLLMSAYIRSGSKETDCPAISLSLKRFLQTALLTTGVIFY